MIDDGDGLQKQSPWCGLGSEVPEFNGWYFGLSQWEFVRVGLQHQSLGHIFVDLISHRIHGAGIYANIWGILMVKYGKCYHI